MGNPIPDRIAWAIDTMEIAPTDRVLEIGCGNGTAVAVLADRLPDCSIVAIDRSEKMIRSAIQRNREAVSLGRVQFHQASLNEMDAGQPPFDAIFAINVNLFWMEPAVEWSEMKTLLRPDGTVYLFNQPPSASKMQEIADRTSANLTAAGFAVKEVRVSGHHPVPAVCVIAKRI